VYILHHSLFRYQNSWNIEFSTVWKLYICTFFNVQLLHYFAHIIQFVWFLKCNGYHAFHVIKILLTQFTVHLFASYRLGNDKFFINFLFYNRERKCPQRGTNWICEYYETHFCYTIQHMHYSHFKTQSLQHSKPTKWFTFHILDIMNIVEIILRNCCITDDIHMRPHTA
jgi:hypothetical protein